MWRGQTRRGGGEWKDRDESVQCWDEEWAERGQSSEQRTSCRHQGLLISQSTASNAMHYLVPGPTNLMKLDWTIIRILSSRLTWDTQSSNQNMMKQVECTKWLVLIYKWPGSEVDCSLLRFRECWHRMIGTMIKQQIVLNICSDQAQSQQRRQTESKSCQNLQCSSVSGHRTWSTPETRITEKLLFILECTWGRRCTIHRVHCK